MANENENSPAGSGGIACPHCGTVENYAGKQNKKLPDGSIERIKECKACGLSFKTLEVCIGIAEIKKRK
jgi:transcriptional regulator NrdR family protein